MRHRGFRLAVLVAAIAAAIFLYSYFQDRKNSSNAPISVAIATWPGFAISNVTKEFGLFDGLNVDIKIIDDPTARLTAFRSGKVDVMISSLDVFAQESADGFDGRIFMVTDTSSGADGIVVRPDIKVVADLVGKAVAVAKGAPSHFFLYSLFKKERQDLKSIRLVFFDDPTLAGQAFVSGKVDAAVTWEPLLSQIVEKGQGRLLASSADTPDTIVDVLVGSSKFLSDRDRVRRFVGGWQKGIDLTKSQPSTAFPIIARALSMPAPAPGENVLAGLALADRTTNRKLLCSTPNGAAPADTILGNAQAFWVDQGIIPSVKLKPDQLVDRFMCQ